MTFSVKVCLIKTGSCIGVRDDNGKRSILETRKAAKSVTPWTAESTYSSLTTATIARPMLDGILRVLGTPFGCV